MTPLDKIFKVSVHRRQDSPDKAAEFSCDGSDSDMSMFALVKANEFSVKPVLCLESDRDDGRGLTLTSSVENEFGGNAVSVVPGGLYQKTSGVSVAGFGNRSSAF
jgi:hypothetical protein